jgi:hypothetical protein
MNNQKTNLVHILLVGDNEGDILLTSEALEIGKDRNQHSKKWSGSS